MAQILTTRDQLRRLEEAFRDTMAPLLDENVPEDFAFAWEFERFIHLKKLKALTSEHERIKKFKEVLARP